VKQKKVTIDGGQICHDRMGVVKRGVEILVSQMPEDFDWTKHNLVMTITPKTKEGVK